MTVFVNAKIWRPGSRALRFVAFMLSVLVSTSALTAIQIAATPDAANAVACASGMTSQGNMTAVPSHGQVFYIDSGVTPKVDAAYVGYRITSSTDQTVWTSLEGFTGGKVQLANPADQYQQLVLNSGNSKSLTAFYLLKALGSTTTAQGHTLKIYDRRPDLTGATALLTCTFSFTKVAETIKANSNKVNTVTVTNSGSTAKPTLGGTVTVAITSAATGKIGNGSSPDLALFWATPASQSTWPTQALRLESTSIALGCQGSGTLTLTNRLTTSGSEFTTCTSQNNQTWTASYVFRVIGPGASVTPAPVAVISSGTQYKHSDAAISGAPAIDLTGVSPVTAAVTTSVTLAASYVSTPDSTHARIKYTATVSTNSASAISIDELVSKHSTGAAYVANSTKSGLGSASGNGPEPSELAVDSETPKPKHFIGPFTGIKTGSPTSYVLEYNYDIPCDGTSYSASVFAYVGNVEIAKDASNVSGITISASSGGCSSPTINTVDVSLAPTVTTSPATSVNSTSATLNGWFNASGNTGVTQRFIWGTDPNLIGATAETWTSITGTSATSVPKAITGLTSAKVYYFQAQIKNAAGAITYGDVLTFKTWDVQKNPTAVTQAATGVTTSAVTMNGTFNPNGIPITGVYFRYSASSTVTSGALSGTYYDLQVKVDDGTGNGTTNLSYLAGTYADIAVNTDDPLSFAQYAPTGSGQQNPALSGTYYFQIRLTCTPTSTFCPNSYINGPVLSFTMGAATASTETATAIADTTATLNGTVKSPTNSGGSSTSIKFCYATSDAVSATTGALTTCLNSGPNNANTASIAQNITQTTYLNVTGLTHGTVYYFQIIAQVGSGAITYGSVLAFQTLDITTTSPLGAGVIGTNYTAFTFQGVGGSTTYSWSVNSGTIAPGMTLGSNGLYSGTPTTAGTYTIVVRLTDTSTGTTTDETFVMTVTGAPTVATSAASSVTGTGAVMNGSVNPNGSAITSASWCWGTSQSLSTCTQVLISNTVYNAWSISSSNATTASLTGLSSGTTYYYKLTAQNNNGTVVSTPIISFTTTGAPSVATTGATVVTGSTVTLGGTVSPNGSTISASEICIGASAGSMADCATISQTFGSWATSSTNNVASRAVTGLTPGATYYYKIAATNSDGTSESSALAFTMASTSTLSATGVGSAAATIRGSLTAGTSSLSTSDVTTIELCYSASDTVTNNLLSSSPSCTSVTKSAISAGTSTTFSTGLTGLAAGTQYWSQIKVTFSNSTVIQGALVSFTTLAAPSATIAPASSVGITTATLNGSVDAKGSAISSATFCYGTASDLTGCNTVSVTITGWTTGSGNNAISTITGLTAGTKYYFKLSAINGIGTGVSGITNFTTIDAPVVTVAPSVRVTSRGATINGSVDRKGARLNKVTFCWRSSSPISSLADCLDDPLDSTTVTTINGNNSSSQISKIMSGLTPRTTYYYLVTATSGNGGVVTASVKGAKVKTSALRSSSMRIPSTGYSGTVIPNQSIYAATAPDVVVYSSSSSFTTAGAVTNSATSVGATSANINGTLYASSSGLASADVTNVKLCYSTSNAVDANGLLSSSPICSSDLWNSGSIAANGNQSYSVATATLTPSTTYYSQIQSTFYDGSTANGSVVSFATPALPSATTNSATSISQNAAVLNGTINANGTTLNSVSFCYGTDAALTGCTSVTVTRPVGGWSTGSNAVSATISSLTSSTKYYYQVTGVNDYGTVSGAIIYFFTQSSLAFDSQGGTPVSTIYHDPNAVVTKPTDPTQTGYTFAGWYDASTSGNAINWSTPFAGTNQTVYARWTPIAYNVTYNTHGGSTPTDGSTTYTIGGTVTLPSAPTQTGYTFQGWSTSATGSAISGSTYNPPSTGDITLHALWHAIDYTLVFDSHSGSAVADRTYNIGGSVTKPTDPTRDGYQFNGWYTSASSGTLITWPYAAPTGGTTLHAQWTAYTVTFSNGSYGGTVPGATAGPVPSLPTDPGMTPPGAGYTFSGWACPTGTGTLSAGSAFTPTSNVICTAVWAAANSKTVTFHSNFPGVGNTNSTSTQQSNIAANLSTNGFSKAGYTFAGWSLSDSSSTITYAQNAEYSFGSNIDLYAVWTANTYTVTFNSQGGTSVASKNFTTGGSVTAPTDPTRAGYNFDGWFVDPNIGTALTFPYAPGTTSNVTLYAQWTPDPKTVTFHSNYPAGTNSTTTQSNYVTTRLDPTSFSINGYTFAGWSLASNSTTVTYTATANYDFLSALDLYAVWTANSNPVVYNTQGGSSVANGSYLTGGAVTLPSAPTKSGYVFAGWFTGSSGGSALGATYTPSAGTTGSITIWAQWTAGTNTVIFNSHGGSSVPDGSFTTGSSVSIPTPDPTLTGNEFKGWFLAATGGSHLNFPYTPGTVGTLTLHAQWAPWVVTFALGSGGTTPATGTVPDPMSGVIAHLPGQGFMNAPAGYVFGGWTCTGSVTNYPEGASITPAGTTTCTAVWNVSTGRTVTFHSNYPAGTNTTTTQGSATATTLNPNAFVAGGFAFGGWATSAGGGVVFTDRATYDFNLDADLYAVWHRQSSGDPAYVINFLYQGGAAGITVTYYTIGAPGISLPSTEKPGYTFAGWTLAPSSNTTVSAPFTTNANVTLYAQWTPNTVTITFKYLGGTPGILTAKYKVGNPGINLPTSSKSGFGFGGWSLISGGSNPVENPYSPTQNTTLYAIWDGTQYSVTLTPAGGEPVIKLKYTIGGPGLDLPELTDPVLTFIGWNPNTNAIKGVNEPYKPNKDVTLYPVWKDIPANTNVFFGGDSPVIDAKAKTILRKLAKIISKARSHPQMVVDGWVKETLNKSYDQQLSAQRAKNAAAYLRSIGVDAVARITPKGISPENTAASRRVDISVYYSGPDKKKKA